MSIKANHASKQVLCYQVWLKQEYGDNLYPLGNIKCIDHL